MHVIACIRQGLRHPLAMLEGVKTFRSDFTKHYDDWDVLESHDCGRELAHIVTLRRYDW